jgi:hypothetical protein
MLGDPTKTELLAEARGYLELAPGSSPTQAFADKVSISSVCRLAQHTQNMLGDSSKTSLVAEARGYLELASGSSPTFADFVTL